MAALRRDRRDPNALMASVLSSAVPTPGPILDLAVARDWSSTADATYLSEPNILSAHTGFSSGTDGGPEGFRAFDIVSNPIAVFASGNADAYRTRLRQGTFDSIVEGVLLASACCGVKPAERTGALWGGASAAAPLKVVRSVDALREFAIPAEVQARMADEIAAGATVVLSADVVSRQGIWWRVDPRTGATLAIGTRGWGNALVEFVKGVYATLTAHLPGWAIFVIKLVLMGMCMAVSIIEGASGHPGAGVAGIALCVIAGVFGLAAGGATAEGAAHLAAGATGAQVSISTAVFWIAEIIHLVSGTYEEVLELFSGHEGKKE